MPRILEPVTVVKTPEVDITEYAGNGSSGQACISIANVKAEGGWAEPWQTPEFDEWVLVTKGRVLIEHSHGPTVEVVAGKAVYLAKGERVKWVFPEGGAEYVSPRLHLLLSYHLHTNCHRRTSSTQHTAAQRAAV